MKPFLTTFVCALAVGFPTLSFAHTELAKSVPANGAELGESPQAIEIQFKSAAKLTSVVVNGADKKERRLDFVAGEKANAFSIKNPKLEPGRNEVVWKALSNDGHVATGKLTYIVKPTIKPAKTN